MTMRQHSKWRLNLEGAAREEATRARAIRTNFRPMGCVVDDSESIISGQHRFEVDEW
jgi:hypothetical protein